MGGPIEQDRCPVAVAADASAAIPLAEPPPGERMALLVRTIEQDVIPRLMLAHRANGVAAPGGGCIGMQPSAEDVELLVAQLVAGNATGAGISVRRLRERGMSIETLLLALLAPAARRLGQMWEADECDFTVVTMSLWRLQRLMQELSPAFQLDAQPPADGRRILLTAVPGEQHTFGLFMVAEFFRRAGWEVVDAPFDSVDELCGAAARDWYSVIGLSIAGERWVDRLRESIASLRQRSRNRTVSIMAGGPIFQVQSELRARVGADGTAADARRAVELAHSLLSMQRMAS